MKPQKTLCLGGHLDGQFIETDSSRINMPVLEKLEKFEDLRFINNDDLNTINNVDVVVYKMVKLADNLTYGYVLATDSVIKSGVIKHLIEGYKT